VLGELDGLVEGLAKISESRGDFGLEVTLGDGGENAAEGGVEIAGGEVIVKEERTYSLASLFSGEAFGFLLGMEVAEMRMA
jgi:hypothetical protein